MQKEQIVVGKSYVNEDARLVREVVAEVDRRHIRTNTFDLATGKLVPTRHNVWSVRGLAEWADRETEPAETARIHPFEQSAWFDVLFPATSASAPLEQARTALEGMPGPHAVPLIR